MIRTSQPAADVGFLDQDYRQKTVPTQIPFDLVLTPIPYTGRKFPSGYRTNAASRNINSKQYALNVATAGLGFLAVLLGAITILIDTFLIILAEEIQFYVNTIFNFLGPLKLIL